VIKPELNMRYYNGEIDDDLPYTGVLNHDPETGHIYDEDGDVVDENTLASFCEGGGKGDDDASVHEQPAG
jgi:hypothetical protein